MKKHTEIELRYRQFDIISKIILYLIFALASVSGVLYVFLENDTSKAFFGFLLSISTATIFVASSIITKKRGKYLNSLREERNTIIRTGIFKQIYDEYKYDGFAFNLIFDKLLFEEYCNNSLDIGIIKNNHEFIIDIDERQIIITVGKKTDNPIESKFILADIVSIQAVYSEINEFILTHS